MPVPAGMEPTVARASAFGGYGVMNTDGEWNDARQAQFAETHSHSPGSPGRKSTSSER